MVQRSSLAASSARGWRSAARNLGWLLASRGVLAVLSLLYLGIATRALGIGDFGRFALVTGAAQGLALLVGFQTWQVVVRYGVDHRAREDEAALGRLYRACMLLDLGAALIGMIAAAIILVLWRDSMGISSTLLRDTAIFTVAQLVAVRSTAVGILRLSDKFAWSAGADSVTPLVRFFGAVAAAAFMPTLPAFLWVWAAAEVATGATYWWLLLRSGDAARLWSARGDRQRLLAENPHFVRFLINSNMVSTLGLATKQLPILFVGGFVGPGAAGAFRISLQMAQALSKLSQLIARAAFPEVVRTIRSVSAEQLASVVGRMFFTSSAVAIVILGLVALIGRPTLVLVGGDSAYASAYPLLLWLAAAGSIDLAVVSFEPLLLAADRSGTAMISRGAAVVVQIALMVLLLPQIGAAGASIGVFGGSLVGALLLGVTVVRYARPASGA